MKHSIKPGACSMASHLIRAERVDAAKGETASGANYRDITPKGKAPALAVGGEVLSEGPAILQFLGDRAGKLGLAPTGGAMARVGARPAVRRVLKAEGLAA